MLHLLKRHPIPIKAFFRHSLVLTYAVPQECLKPLLPPGLILDTYDGFGFVAIAMVQTEHLRPAFVPEACGCDFFLAGYRVFSRFTTSSGRTLRGLRILRSDANHEMMVRFGNLLTHYSYRKADVDCIESENRLEIKIRTSQADADLHVVADLSSKPSALPGGSPFRDMRDARKFAGPLPFTFDYEAETHSIIMIQGVRQNWDPQQVQVEVIQNTFLSRAPFNRTSPVLASAFHVHDIAYLWKRGVCEPLTRSR